MSDTKSKYASGGAGSDSALVPTETPTEASGAPAKPAGATAGTTHFPVNAGCVINPRNDYMKKWDLVMLALLLFTAVVTPFEVGGPPGAQRIAQQTQRRAVVLVAVRVADGLCCCFRWRFWRASWTSCGV